MPAAQLWWRSLAWALFNANGSTFSACVLNASWRKKMVENKSWKKPYHYSPFAPFSWGKNLLGKTPKESPHEYMHVWVWGCAGAHVYLERGIHLPDPCCLPFGLGIKGRPRRLFVKFIRKSFKKTLLQPGLDSFKIRRVRPERAQELDFWEFLLGKG